MSMQATVTLVLTCPDCPAPLNLGIPATLLAGVDDQGRETEPEAVVKRSDIERVLNVHAHQHTRQAEQLPRSGFGR